MITNKEIGQRIAKARQALNLTQAELAERLSVQAPAVSRWESGINGLSAADLPEVAAALGVSIRSLVATSPEISPEPPENWEDWPEELQQAMAYTGELSAESRRYVYKLWREQALAHALIRRQELTLEAKVAELKRLAEKLSQPPDN